MLYLSPNGLTEPHVASQVLPYLRSLRAGNEFILLTLEKAGADPVARAAIEDELRLEGIESVQVPYRGWPWGTVGNVRRMRAAIRRILARRRIDLVHARSYMPAEAARPICAARGLPLLFDLRGFHIDERVDGGQLRKGSLIYRLLKRMEARLLRQSDACLVLTEEAKRILLRGSEFSVRPKRVEVVPCAVDLERFRPASQRAPGLRIAYTGSLGTFYDHRGMAKAFAMARAERPQAVLEVASLQSVEPLVAALLELGLPREAVRTRRAAPAEVPGILQQAQAGICFLKPTFSKRASCPIKVAEYLASGLPILVTAGAGDYESFVEQERVGAVVDAADTESIQQGVERWLALMDEAGIAQRCRSAAEQRYDVHRISRTYQGVYEALSP